MSKLAYVSSLLGVPYSKVQQSSATAFAPTNIALCKYWGKRDSQLNLPVTSSLSISLGNKGSTCTLSPCEGADHFTLNGEVLNLESGFSLRLREFLDLFREPQSYLTIDTQMNIPVAAGLASSACGFAALVLGLNQLYDWKLSLPQLSTLARLGSGSAARSVYSGFVEWEAGVAADGRDSLALSLDQTWPQLCVGLMVLSKAEKSLSSRTAMERTMATSLLYHQWPAKVAHDLPLIKEAIKAQNFPLLGQTAESNALTMHALMLSAWPPISYALPQTQSLMQKIWHLRAEGLPLYFTQDAGPNLKLLFLNDNAAAIQKLFPELELIRPFS